MLSWMCGVRCFFFQAEDGIRDLVRSRGLGDVYKRQVFPVGERVQAHVEGRHVDRHPQIAQRLKAPVDIPVSYTHLTLPTSDLV